MRYTVSVMGWIVWTMLGMLLSICGRTLLETGVDHAWAWITLYVVGAVIALHGVHRILVVVKDALRDAEEPHR
jgi:hypothetical protein